MQERPLNTDDLAGAQSADQPTEPLGDTEQPGETGRPDLSVVQGGEQATQSGERPVADTEAESPEAAGAGAGQSLLPSEQTDEFQLRWRDIQASFVDQPRESVEQADLLVADLLQRLAAGFADERKRLEGQWDRGGDVSTEDLRVALTRYRSFFDRLLAA
jgi:hypothetical protein